ncbi:MAG: aspartate aminotransferase family protein [Lachnospiraceae bacterium]
MNEKETMIQQAEAVLYKTYNRYPVIFDHGQGVYLYDSEGKKYLDFYAGIAVTALGYHNETFDQALKDQVDKLLHISNYFYNQPSIDAGEKLLKASGMEKVFFTNSGTEAVEGALKIARRYAYDRDGCHDHEIIAMEHSFHGRSMGALSVTGNDHYQEPFKPLIPGIRFARFNDLDSVKALVNEKTCAIILEPIQGEGGIYPADPEFLEGLRQLCDQHDMLLIFDEIQCGMGRTGSMFAWQKYGVKPDVLTAAKALGNGVPIGAFLATGKAAYAMVPGDHGTTYGGNPFVTAAANAVLTIFEKDQILTHVNQVGEYLYQKLESLKERYPHIVAHRGMGLIQGLEFDQPVGEIVKKALLEEQLVLISAGSNIIRFVPPLVIEECHVDEMVEKLERALK